MADTAGPPKLPLSPEAARIQEDARRQEQTIVNQARKAGVPAYQFDPQATPDEKAAVAKKEVPPGLDLSKHVNKMGVAAVTANDSRKTTHSRQPSKASVLTNGTVPITQQPSALREPDYSKTGWEPRFGSLNDALDIKNQETTADHQTWAEKNLDDKFFGEWYHNAGIMIFACLASYIVTKLNLGLGWVLLVMAICGTYYRTSIRRVRRNVRDELTREAAKAKLDSDQESMEWMNSFVVKFWPIFMPQLADQVIAQVDATLAQFTPGFLDSIKMTTFTLGTKPPRVEHVKTHPKLDDDIVQMDWQFSFTPNDTADLTSRQLKNKIDPKVVLEVRVGKGLASKGIPIIVEDMAFSGLMRIKIKLQVPPPYVEKVDVCFLERPTFDFVLKPLGGDTFGFDINFLPGLESFIHEQIHGNLEPMFYAPNVFSLNIAQLIGGAPIDTAIGVVAITIHNAHGLKNSDKFSGTPDPYVSISINDRAELARTKTVYEDSNPRFNETRYIIVNNLNDSLTLNVFDYNEFRKDAKLGAATFSLDRLQNESEVENETVPVINNNRERGNVSCDIRFFPVLEGRTLEDGTKEPPPETTTGIVRFTVSTCKELDHTKSMVGQLSPYAQILLNKKVVHKTKAIKRNNNPIWEESHEMLITNKKTTKLGVIIKDERDFTDDLVLGKYQIELTNLLESMEKGQDWFNLLGAKTGRVKLTAQWQPIALKGVVGGSGGYATPVGVMRIHVQNAVGLKNLETVGKSDPYTRIMLSGVAKARTVTFQNTLDPAWDEVLYVPVHSSREKLRLEVMDQESRASKDRPLGHVEFSLEEFLKTDEEGLYQECNDERVRTEPLMLDKKSSKGTLTYAASFFPCLNIADPEEEEEEGKAQALQVEIASEAMQTTGQSRKSAELPRKSGEGDKPGPPQVDGDDSPPIQSPMSAAFTVNSENEATEKKPPRVRLTPDELLSYETGLLIFKIIEGHLAHKDCCIEVLMDNMTFPAFCSSRIRSKDNKVDEIGDAMVKELEFSQITVRLREHGEQNEDGILAKLTGNTLTTLKQCLNNPTVLTLKGEDGETSRISISMKYVPILMKLNPSESINNQGTLRVKILDAANLPAADRNGKSDPFCVFTLDGKKVHESSVQKKTLHPAWNEDFETKVASRTASDFVVEIFDQDFAGKPDFLGRAHIDITALDPFKAANQKLRLLGKKDEAGDFGELRLRMTFTPDWIARTRQGSSTFHGTFAAPGKLVAGVAGAPLRVGTFAAGGITKGASFLKKGLGRKKDREGDIVEELDQEIDDVRPASRGSVLKSSGSNEVLEMNGAPNDAPKGSDRAELGMLDGSLKSRRRTSALAAPFASPHRRSRSVSSQQSAANTGPSGPESGTASIRLLSASGFPGNANLQIRIRPTDKNKDIFKSRSIKNAEGKYEWDDGFTYHCTADQQFKISAKDDHFLRSDADLGEGLFVVDDTGRGEDTVVGVGAGKVVLRTNFRSDDRGSDSSPKSTKRGLRSRGRVS